jgi:hypothetical protein
MLLDDLNQCIYYGYGQVITYDKLDEFYVLGLECKLYRGLPKQIFNYDVMIEEISTMEFVLDKYIKETEGGDK